VSNILCDPTETRNKTRLPDNVASQSTNLQGLEAVTGADILITTKSIQDDIRLIAKDKNSTIISHLRWRGYSVGDIAKSTNRPVPFVLEVLKFYNACQSGILIQRKTSRDICSIIPGSHGSVILNKMMAWCPENWLAVVDARVERNRNDKLVINGIETNYYYNALDGALDAWARRGGFIKWIPRDKDLMVWLTRQLDYLRKRTDEKVLELRQPLQRILGPNDDVSHKLSILSALKHVGVGKAKALLDHYGSIAGTLEAILDPSFVTHENRCEGIGEKIVIDNRKLFGLSERWMKMIVTAEENE